MHRAICLLARPLARSPAAGARRAHVRAFSRTTKEGDPGEQRKPEDDEPCDRKETAAGPAAGRIVTPETDKQTYAPEGPGHDPADQGAWLKEGDDAGAEKFWEKQEKKAPDQQHKCVKDKVTGELLFDSEVLVDRKSE